MSDPITDLREALKKARETEARIAEVGDAASYDAAEAAWSAVSAAIEEVEGERERLNAALSKIMWLRPAGKELFGPDAKRLVREIEDIAKAALNPEKTNAD